MARAVMAKRLNHDEFSARIAAAEQGGVAARLAFLRELIARQCDHAWVSVRVHGGKHIAYYQCRSCGARLSKSAMRSMWSAIPYARPVIVSGGLFSGR
jgi:hypothetical protein